ncbi:MAG TPA: endonuclease III [Aquifex aeolicus]|nr:endonuclease III [Aquifex aeolicus]
MAKRKGKGTRSESGGNLEGIRKKTTEIIQRLEKIYPNPRLELEYENAFQLLVMAILAAQESDKVVNEVAKEFFKKYKTPKDIADANLEGFQNDLKRINFYRRKAKLLKECCEKLVKFYNGEVPKTVDELVKLPGVGRKTANMVIGGAYNLPAIIVDRHVHRVTQRISLSKQKNPDKMERELMDIVPKEFWTKFSLLLLTHGKTICKAKNPQCDKCVIRDLCAYGSGTND